MLFKVPGCDLQGVVRQGIGAGSYLVSPCAIWPPRKQAKLCIRKWSARVRVQFTPAECALRGFGWQVLEVGSLWLSIVPVGLRDIKQSDEP